MNQKLLPKNAHIYTSVSFMYNIQIRFCHKECDMSTQKRKNDTFANILYGAMLALVVGIMPLVVRVVARNVTPDLRHLTAGHMQDMPYIYFDLFVSGKLWVLAVTAIVIVFYCVGNWATSGKMPQLKLYLKRIPIVLSLVYLAFVFISALRPGFLHTSWFGTMDRQEGAIMWLLYFVVFAAAMFYVRDIKHTKPILWGLAFSSIIMGLVGFSQLIDRNLLATNFAMRMITLGVGVDSLTHSFEIAHGTLYNPNTYGKYTAMVAPILLLGGIVYEGKIYTKIAMLAGGALMLIGIFASGSLGGLIGIISATGVLVVTYVCYFFKSREGKQGAKAAGIFVGAAMIIAAALMFVAPLNYRFTTLLARLQEAAAAETDTHERFDFEGDSVFAYRGQSKLLSVTVHSVDNNEISFTVRDGANIEIAPDSVTAAQERTIYVFYVPELGPLNIQRVQNHFLLDTARQLNPFLLHFDNGTIYGVGHRGLNTIDFSEPIPAWGFAGRETWGSGRGYIWSRSLPLMPSRTIIGSGPDTFVNVFPYYDMTGLHLTFNSPYHIVDKAHNLFIQTWITTGGISAIALFGLFFFYLATTFWGLVTSKDEPRYSFGLRLGLLAGISVFVMAGFGSLSTIGSTGVFFVLLGMGYGLNWILKNQGQATDNKAKNAAKPNNKA